MVEPDNFPTLEYEFITTPYQYPHGERFIRSSDARKFFQKVDYQTYLSMYEKYPEKYGVKFTKKVFKRW